MDIRDKEISLSNKYIKSAFCQLYNYVKSYLELNEDFGVYSKDEDYYNFFIYDRTNYGEHIHVFRKCRDSRINIKVGYQSWQLTCSYGDDKERIYARKTENGHFLDHKLNNKQTIGYWMTEEGHIVNYLYLIETWIDLLKESSKKLSKVKKGESIKEIKNKISQNIFSVLDVEDDEGVEI